ncbi:MAG: PhzF family phenazine biosynthesis protein [Herpetosiphonaceae bacterium]|nr:PhzF family phenazine biosynthesis protein [Herpetosiphonaceae bacterium]
MSQTITQVDAFTDTPFRGNPAAVCILAEARDATWMQHVAQEMNLAETAFLLKQADGYQLRWFTPTVEVDLCGHATLASAHVLWSEGHLPPTEQARFHTLSGLLTARRQEDGWIELDFPAEPAQPSEAPPALLSALGVTPIFVGKNRLDYLVEVDGEAIVRGVAPDFRALQEVGGRGAIVTSRASSTDYQFVSRCFFPAAGINEDPVTGSAHCALGPYWGNLLRRDELVGYQASPRGGIVRVRLNGDRVGLSGQAVTVLRGELV